MFDIPVLMIIFNRPDLTQKVFAAVREVQPQYLYVAADGPRSGNKTDKKLCEQTKKIITENIDWKCEVKFLFREKNLGCGKAPANAITWFFNHVEEGIILEDDTVPNSSFFHFCKVMLEKYKNNNRVMNISGNCFIPFSIPHSYYFTKYPHTWGWATWKRAWGLFDYDMLDWKNKNKTSFLHNKLHHSRAEKYWEQMFNKVTDVEFTDIWDFQWIYTCWRYDGLSICPAVNLVTNIGFRNDATHCFDQTWSLANIPTREIDIQNIIHPLEIKINKKADDYSRDEFYLGKKEPIVKSLLRKINHKKIKSGLGSILPTSIKNEIKLLFNKKYGEQE